MLDQNQERTPNEIREKRTAPVEMEQGRVEAVKGGLGMDKDCEAIAGVRAEVDKLSEKVAMLDGMVLRGDKVAERELTILIELLMVQLLKLDGIEADGEARVQRRVEVLRVQSMVEKLDNLKASNPKNGGGVNGLAAEFDAGGGQTALQGSSTRVTYDWEQFE